ncbi:MAG: DUF4505 family protein [Candidatus Kapabacteria bacterium]|nr:DUF4505 family protein [Candidatus Kapabacteria bacterium]
MMRDFYYELTDRGVLHLNGFVQDDPWFLDFFFRRLAPTANPEYPEYPFVCRCGDEMNYLKPSDTPIVYTGFDGSRLFYGHSLTTPFYPERLSYSEDGVLYHWAPVGERARIVPAVATEIAKHIDKWGPYYAFLADNGRALVPLLPLHLQDAIEILRPKRDNQCVGCGMANPFSLRLSFVRDKVTGTVHTWLRPDERMNGSMGTTHGGFVSLLLDETMGKSLSSAGIKAPTARLAVNFRKPMVLGEEYEIHSWIDSQQGRKNFVKGEIRATNDHSIVVADAEALFIEVRPPA